MLAIGVFLNAVAPLKYKNKIQRFFENPKWKLNAAIMAFTAHTFHRVFGEKILSWQFFLTSIVFSLCGFAVFTSIYFMMNSDPICKYPVDWCNGFRADLVRETLILLTAMIVIDILSFAQTSFLIRYARRSERSYELIFIAYADMVLTLSIFCFVLPMFLTLNQIMIPESDKKTDVFAQLSPSSKHDEMLQRHKKIQEPLPPPEEGEPPDPPESATEDETDEDLLRYLTDSEAENLKLKEFAKNAQAQLFDLRLYIRDYNKKSDRLLPSADGPAVIKGSIEEIEALVRSVGAKNGIPTSVEQHRTKYEKETIRVLKANVNLIQVPPVKAYVAFYGAVLNINNAFTLFLRGSPLFVDMNREPVNAMIGSVQGSANKQYICICANDWYLARDPSVFLNEEKYLVFDSKLFTGLAQSHVA